MFAESVIISWEMNKNIYRVLPAQHDAGFSIYMRKRVCVQ